MKDILGAHMKVGEEAVDVESPHVKQSHNDTCAIKSQQLVLEKFGIHRTEDELVQQAYDNGWYRPGGGTKTTDMGKILNDNGVSCTNYENGNIAQVVSALADGKQIIMGVDSYELWEAPSWRKLWEKIEDRLPLVGGADHALLVTGIDASDPSDVKVIVTDPGSGALNKPYPLKQFIDAAEDSRFFMTVTDNPAPDVFDAFEPGTTHLPMIGDMNYYEFINQFSDYMQDGDVIPDSVWDDFKLSAFGAGTVGIIPEDVEINDEVKEVDNHAEAEIADNDDDNTTDYQEEENDHQQDEHEDDDNHDDEEEDHWGDDDGDDDDDDDDDDDLLEDA